LEFWLPAEGVDATTTPCPKCAPTIDRATSIAEAATAYVNDILDGGKPDALAGDYEDRLRAAVRAPAIDRATVAAALEAVHDALKGQPFDAVRRRLRERAAEMRKP
jgi:hypothetical protein